MDFDETKKIDVEVSENQIVENRVAAKRKFSLKGKGIDLLDIAIVPVAVGVFVSLGFLFASLFRATPFTALSDITSIVAAIL